MPRTAPADPGPEHLLCTRCGYDLHTLGPQGGCPECGCAVAESLRAWSLRPTTRLRWWSRVYLEVTVLLYGPALTLALGTWPWSHFPWEQRAAMGNALGELLLLASVGMLPTSGLLLLCHRPARRLPGFWVAAVASLGAWFYPVFAS